MIDIHAHILPGLDDGARDMETALAMAEMAGSRCPLIEFPFEGYGRQATEILAGVAALGFRPIVAHPERYCYVQQSPELLNRWVELG